jgi:hypothetical protein
LTFAKGLCRVRSDGPKTKTALGSGRLFLSVHFRSVSFPCGSEAVIQKFDHYGHNGYENNGQDDQSKVILDNRNIAKEVASEKKDSDPDQPSYHVITDEVPIGHPPDPSHKGRKGTNDGNEPS